MNRNSLLIATLAGAFWLLPMGAFAQTDTTRALTREQINANKQEIDSAARESKEQLKAESRDNANTLKDLEANRKDSQAKARDARRASNEAADAAKQSKRAASAERSAQKSRSRANKQANRAEKATERSERNR